METSAPGAVEIPRRGIEPGVGRNRCDLDRRVVIERRIAVAAAAADASVATAGTRGAIGHALSRGPTRSDARRRWNALDDAGRHREATTKGIVGVVDREQPGAGVRLGRGELAGAHREHRRGREPLEELAYHWLAATRAADVGKAIGYARQAGDRALASLAFEEAAAHFERALGVLEPRDTDGERLRCDLLLALADAQRRGGDARYRETVAKAAEVARALGDGERLALAALASARPGGFFANANFVEEALMALYDEAGGALPDADSLLRARLLGQLACELVYTPHRGRRDGLSREAVAIARRLGDRIGLAQVLILRLMAMNDPFTLAERLECTAELETLARKLGSSEIGWHAAFHRMGALLESGDIAGAERALAEVERFGGELRQPFYTWAAHMGRTMLGVMRGAPDAEAHVFATFELGTAGGQPDAPVVLGAQLITLRSNQGRIAELADVMRANVEAQSHTPSWRAALARLYTETDQEAEAREQVDILRVEGFERPLDWSWPGYIGSLSEAVCDLKDQPAAAVLYGRLCPVAGQAYVMVVMLVCAGSYALWCGMLAACLGRGDDAEGHFADALAMNERLGARPRADRRRRRRGRGARHGAPGRALPAAARAAVTPGDVGVGPAV